MLHDQVIGIYCIIDDILQEMNHKEHENRKFSDSQVLSTAIISALFFNGNQSKALSYMGSHIFKDMINKSGFTKRLHRLKELLMTIFLIIGRFFKYIACEMEYIIDSFPVKVCHNIRIRRCKLLQGEQYRGYNASKGNTFMA